MSDELNDLTKRLYIEGYTRENHPDTVYWSDYQNLGYKYETMLGFTWETPCGLLIQGESSIGRGLACEDASYGGVWYCPENDDPLLRCPFDRKDCQAVPAGFPFPECPCHRTDRAYDYQKSVEKIELEQAREFHRQYMEITGGSYCACVVDNNGYAGGKVEVKYDVEQCIRFGCKNSDCVIRKQPRDLSRVNVFYDVRRTWITRVGFLEEKKVEVTKGLKVFPKPVARTDAEIWLKVKETEFDPLRSKSVIDHPSKSLEDHRQEYFSKMHRCYGDYDYFEFHYDVENIRIARSEQRDLMQDLQDVADGIEVIHAVDRAKAKAAQKREGRQRRQEAKQRRRTQKILGAKRAAEQLSLFGASSDQTVRKQNTD
jgi:hypothetical protein